MPRRRLSGFRTHARGEAIPVVRMGFERLSQPDGRNKLAPNDVRTGARSPEGLTTPNFKLLLTNLRNVVLQGFQKPKILAFFFGNNLPVFSAAGWQKLRLRKAPCRAGTSQAPTRAHEARGFPSFPTDYRRFSDPTAGSGLDELVPTTPWQGRELWGESARWAASFCAKFDGAPFSRVSKGPTLAFFSEKIVRASRFSGRGGRRPGHGVADLGGQRGPRGG